MSNLEKPMYDRRGFMKTAAKTALVGGVALTGFPTIVPASVFGKNAPSNKINIGQIGCGRIARTHDLVEAFRNDVARIMAVADVDKARLQSGKKMIEGWYDKKMANKTTSMSRLMKTIMPYWLIKTLMQ